MAQNQAIRTSMTQIAGGITDSPYNTYAKIDLFRAFRGQMRKSYNKIARLSS
jgi:hypothetical protein